jgi:hypothetical protein
MRSARLAAFLLLSSLLVSESHAACESQLLRKTAKSRHYGNALKAYSDLTENQKASAQQIAALLQSKEFMNPGQLTPRSLSVWDLLRFLAMRNFMPTSLPLLPGLILPVVGDPKEQVGKDGDKVKNEEALSKRTQSQAFRFLANTLSKASYDGERVARVFRSLLQVGVTVGLCHYLPNEVRNAFLLYWAIALIDVARKFTVFHPESFRDVSETVEQTVNAPYQLIPGLRQNNIYLINSQLTGGFENFYKILGKHPKDRGRLALWWTLHMSGAQIPFSNIDQWSRVTVGGVERIPLTIFESRTSLKRFSRYFSKHLLNYAEGRTDNFGQFLRILIQEHDLEPKFSNPRFSHRDILLRFVDILTAIQDGIRDYKVEDFKLNDFLLGLPYESAVQLDMGDERSWEVFAKLEHVMSRNPGPRPFANFDKALGRALRAKERVRVELLERVEQEVYHLDTFVWTSRDSGLTWEQKHFAVSNAISPYDTEAIKLEVTLKWAQAFADALSD